MGTLPLRQVARCTVPVACLLLVTWFSSACSDDTTAVAQETLSQTVPPGDSAPALPLPVREDQSLQFTWDVDTHMAPTGYATWVAEQLRGFQLVGQTVGELRFAKSVGGDAYRLSITIQSSDGGPTHVHLVLTTSAD